MYPSIEGNTTIERIDWAIRKLQNLGNTIKDGTKSDIVSVLQEAKKALSPDKQEQTQ